MSNLILGLKTAFFLAVHPRRWQASLPQFIAISFLWVAVNIILNRTFYTGAVEFNWYAIRALTFDVPVLLIVGWMAMRLTRHQIGLFTVPVAMLSAMLTLDVVLTVAGHLLLSTNRQLPTWVWATAYYGGYFWVVAIIIVMMWRSLRLPSPYIAVTMVPVLVMTIYQIYFPAPQIWYQAQAPALAQAVSAVVDHNADSPVSEEMLYLQPQLALKRVRALAQQRQGVTDLYFIAFAPFAREDVFMKESVVIRKLMDERFGTRQRSLLLLNHSQTLRDHPLATVTNLRAALKHIGNIIDVDEDVVMLYLTSHGSRQHQLESNFWPLQLEEIEPSLLKRLLDEAGIKWRIVVVSACYAGGYIEPLQAPNTLVITAADATHTSFGCGTESDFTYFAKAFFDEQLRQTYSFEQAFRRAVPVIRDREKGKQPEFSNPQMAMGSDIRDRLQLIEQRLAGKTIPLQEQRILHSQPVTTGLP